ncbi:retrovirus-related pol polyprotein from transposon TNT 1-94 [Tanacetum coccineum]
MEEGAMLDPIPEFIGPWGRFGGPGQPRLRVGLPAFEQDGAVALNKRVALYQVAVCLPAGAVQQGPVRAESLRNLSAEEKERYRLTFRASNFLPSSSELTKDDRESQFVDELNTSVNNKESRAVLDEEQLLFLAVEQVTNVDDDVDDSPENDLALNVDHIFKADECDAFDSDVDKGPTSQTMFMANLTSEDPIYDEAGPLYDLNNPFEVQDHDAFVDHMVEFHEGKRIPLKQADQSIEAIQRKMDPAARRRNKKEVETTLLIVLNNEKRSGNQKGKLSSSHACPDSGMIIRSYMGYGDLCTDILKGSRGTNLYTISIDEMMKSSPICLLSKASKSKSWLWHRRLNHLNFGTINDLARKDLVRGSTRLKVGLNKTVRFIRTDNGTEFVNQVMSKYYEGVGIFHQKSVPRTPQQNGVVERKGLLQLTRIEAIRIFIDNAATKERSSTKMAVKTAFLNGDLQEDVFVCQHEGFETG